MSPITLGPVAQTARTHSSRSGPLLAAVVLAAMLLGLSAGAAAAQNNDDYPPAEITVGTPNAIITISGTNWGPGTTVDVTYRDDNNNTVSSTAAVEADGTFAAQLALPADAALGHAEATISGTGADGQARQDAARVFVQDEAAGGSGDTSVALGSTPGGSSAGAALAGGSGGASGAGTVVPATNLPTTGGMNLALIAFALALLVAGGGALLVARRRQASS